MAGSETRAKRVMAGSETPAKRVSPRTLDGGFHAGSIR
jgi:hypothetical protein